MSGLLRLEGKVVDEQERPAPSALVRLEPGERRVLTGADGGFAFEDLPSRRWWISARLDAGYAGPALVRLADSNQTVSLRLRRGGTLIVHAFAGGAPVVGARLVVAGEALEAITDASGVAVVRGLAPHRHGAWLVASGWAPQLVRVDARRDPADVFEPFIRLQRGARIEGVVLGPGALPVRDASIRFCSVTGGGWIEAANAGDDGRWHLQLPRGAFWLSAVSAHHGPVADVPLRCDGRTPQRDVVLHVDARRTLSGIVTDARGHRVPYAWVGAVGSGGSSHGTSADTNGAFTLSDVSAGELQVFANTWSEASPAVPVPAAPSDAGPISLVVEEARIAGLVVDESEHAVSRVDVELLSPGVRSRFPMIAVTDAAGRFDFGALEPGEHTVRVVAQDSPVDPDGHSVRTGTTDVKLSIGGGALITGRALLDGEPLSYFGVTLSERGGFTTGRMAVRDPDGRFTLRGLDPGTWRITIVAPGTRHAVLDASAVGRGQHIDLGDVVVERGARITGRVRDRTGAAVAGARVFIGWGPALHETSWRLEQWFHGHHEAVTDDTGYYELDGVDDRRDVAGRRLLWATHPRGGASVLRELDPDDTLVDLELLGAGRIEGKVDGLRGGHPLVRAWRPDEPEGARRQILEETGEFAFDDVPAGDYTVSLQVPSNVETSAVRVSVADGDVVSVHLAMASSGVRLTVRVPEGRGMDLVLASADESTPEPEQAAPRIVMRDPVITIHGRRTAPPSGMESVPFDHLVPGNYRASLDGQTWTPIVVAASPAEQVVELWGQTP